MKRYTVITLHFVYWALFESICIFLLYLSHDDAYEIWNDDLLMMNLTAIPAFYIFYYWLFNRFLRKRKLKAFFIMALATCIMIAVLITAAILAIAYGAIGLVPNTELISTLMIGFFLFALVHGIAATALRGMFHWYLELRVKEALRQKSLESELAALKAQLQPHFLFNTINNIDVLIGKQPERASLYLQQLSSLLRYILYKGHLESISVEEEIRFINDYIQLQKIRKVNDEWIQLKLEGDPAGHDIAPLILFPFIENAVKHVSSENGNPSIKMHIHIKDSQLYFRCENSFSTEPQSHNNDDKGIGLSLAKQRLALLYPAKHHLEFRKDKNTFIVHCKLEL